ncbi:class II fructose-1,6-bisphosphate aldolase [Peribacillus muralis]|uniref:class II fructose-1,6-bisphosphate aldolase n=1 Tax=Peribacillus muralis TaxID=264697 RepID=UPI001F4F0859|nr:class II fructose-1,6-bisphosphate aldolase [Peribacillus muralis]MCK1992938.1 class II fructose-1,6-bisphosphate aldolase [Peribacillus muralis]MCK2013493.1 class II fructose-1,6-bisphosphate aldolase [Peribacillus muralis]
MPLVSGKALLAHAHQNQYAIGAFNFANMENLQAVIEAAEELQSPVIIQITEKSIEYAGLDYLYALGRCAGENAKVPVALHLDHGKKWESVIRCLRYGWTSVMMDASHKPFEENIALTRKIVEFAREVNVSVESELGFIGGKEGDITPEGNIYTEVDEAVEFVRRTNTDALAIAVGTAHGIYKGEVNIDFNRIKEIKAQTDIPLVLHGSSGVPDEMIKRAVLSGINKVNFDTEIKLASLEALKAFLDQHPYEYDIRKIYKPARQAMKEKIKEKIKLLSSEGKNWITAYDSPDKHDVSLLTGGFN